MSKSTYVCQRCGLPVHLWGAKGTWKHVANQHSRSCRKQPIVVERAAYEKRMDEDAKAAVTAVRRFLGG